VRAKPGSFVCHIWRDAMLKLFRIISFKHGAIGLVSSIMDVLNDLRKGLKSRKYLPVIYSPKLHSVILSRIN